MLLTGVFAKDVGLLYGPTHTFFLHIGALIFVASFSFFGSYLLFKITDWLIPMRVSALDEELGLDLTQHGESLFAASDHDLELETPRAYNTRNPSSPTPTPTPTPVGIVANGGVSA